MSPYNCWVAFVDYTRQNLLSRYSFKFLWQNEKQCNLNLRERERECEHCAKMYAYKFWCIIICSRAIKLQLVLWISWSCSWTVFTLTCSSEKTEIQTIRWEYELCSISSIMLNCFIFEAHACRYMDDEISFRP